MTTKELNEQTLEFLRRKMIGEEKLLVIAIVVDLKTQEYDQLVGYGVTMPMVADAFNGAVTNLTNEIRRKNTGGKN